MKKIIISIILISSIFFYACEPDQPTAPKLSPLLNDITIAAVGNSLTAGFQSSGMMEDFQVNSYPYLIAEQMNNTKFEQPIIGTPGIGSPAGMTPLYIDSEGNITQDSLLIDPIYLLKNALLSRPYDNLGVPGADLNDLLNTIDGSGGNPFFDMILRNPNLLNTTQLEQVALLQPTILLLWAGNNDVLGAAIDGGDSDQITSQQDFTTRMTAILTQLNTDLSRTTIVMANIPSVTDIPYVNILDSIFVGLGSTPVLFDDTLTPIVFPVPGNYLPLLTAETGVVHVTLAGLMAYQQGLGVPDSTYMRVNLGIPAATAAQLHMALVGAGLTPTGMAIPGNYTLTSAEDTEIADAVTGFNATIQSLTSASGIPLFDANALLNELNTSGLSGASGKFVLVAPANTAFSLDGVHPNNAGSALMANGFIEKINQVLQLDPAIPLVDVGSKLGQYLPPTKISVTKAIKNAGDIFRRTN